MKFLILSALAFACSAQAAQHGYLIKTQLVLKNASHNLNTSSELIIDSKLKEYTAVTAPREGVVLLAKVKPQKSGLVRISYMLIDTGTPAVVRSSSRIVTQFGYPATLTQTDGRDEMSITSTVTESDYTSSEAD